MINPFKDTNWKPGRDELRSFGKSLLWGLPLMAAVCCALVHRKQHVWPLWPLELAGLGMAVGLLVVVAPPVGRPVYLAWYFFACCLGIVLSNVAVAAIFYTVILPVGIGLRICGKDPMRRKLSRTAESYWIDAERGGDPKSYFQQF